MTDDQKATTVKEILNSLLKRFINHLTKIVAIVPWCNAMILPAIERMEQISYDLNRLRNYIRNNEPREQRFRKGRNLQLLVQVTYDKIMGDAEEVQHKMTQV